VGQARFRYRLRVNLNLALLGFPVKKLISCLFASIVVLNGSTLAAETETPDVKIEPIKKAEFFKTQRALFDKADKNFDGSVTQDEISLLNDALNKPKHVKAFKGLDADKNGFLSFREIESKHQEFTTARIDQLTSYKTQLLNRYDQDGNGDISSRELDVYYEEKAKTYEASTKKSAASDLKRKDLDASGSVSLDEYLSTKTAASANAARQARRKGKHFTRDKNGDRIIKRSENELFLEQIFESLDINKDGVLSASEQSDRAYKAAQRFNISIVISKFDLAGQR